MLNDFNIYLSLVVVLFAVVLSIRLGVSLYQVK